MVSNPVGWSVGTVSLSFPEVERARKARHEEVFIKPRPEIKHQFRVPEKRPPQVVSDAFTIACLAPAFLLLILVSQLEPTPTLFSSTMPSHVSVAA